jgi:single-stranded-DNA-specific exonuclease
VSGVRQIWEFAPCPTAAADRLAADLGLHRTTAEVLVRRGYAEPEAARAFLEDDGPRHDPLLLGDMAAACGELEEAIASGRRICVHGDYDADGICATALALLVLRRLGASVEWHLPSRFEEGYGVAMETVERLAAGGVELLLTVDCGITAVEQVARARQLGMRVIVTDHHRPGPQLPDAPRVAVRPSDYPFPDLCGTGVVYKLGQALFARAGLDPAELEQHLDLVALATVADVVPLVDENRALVRAGLRRLARTAKPGLRALMHTARVDRVHVSSGDLGFRLAPRINAAGRLCHPQEALALLLTGDEREAATLAQRLEGLNRERQAVEDGILRSAVEQIEDAPPEWRERHAYVLASPDWHEGVIGIVASRLVERYRRPVVLIAELGEESKGSGRSPTGYDLHAGLAACHDHLLRYGGHRVAAGLTIASGEVPAFAAALAAHAADQLGGSELMARQRVDAILAPAEATLDLADELARLEPFGLGNPAVTLLAPAAAVRDPQRIGADGRHLRCGIELGGYRCGAVGFGMGGAAGRLAGGGRHDVAFRLQRNAFNGSVSAQMVLRAVEPAAGRGEIELPESVPAVAAAGRAGMLDRRRLGLQHATLVRLLCAGESVLVVAAHAGRRRELFGGVLDPARWLSDAAAGRLAVTDYPALLERPPEVLPDHVLALDPPVDAEQAAELERLAAAAPVHRVWGRSEAAFALAAAEAREPLRPTLAAVWRARREGADGAIAALPAQTIARCLEVLAEVGLDREPDAGVKVDLNVSPAYRAALERAERSRRYVADSALPAAG